MNLAIFIFEVYEQYFKNIFLFQITILIELNKKIFVKPFFDFLNVNYTKNLMMVYSQCASSANHATYINYIHIPNYRAKLILVDSKNHVKANIS